MPNPLYLLTNSAWNAIHFRDTLWRHLLAEGRQVIAIVPDGPAVSQLREAGLGVELLYHLSPHGAGWRSEARFLLELTRLFRRLPPGPIYGFTPKCCLYGGLAAAFTRRDFYPTWTGLGYLPKLRGGSKRVVRRLLPLAMRPCPRVYFHNASDRQLFVDRAYVLPERARVVAGSGVDPTRFQRTPVPSRAGGLRLLFLGRLLAEKGLPELVGAIKRLQERGYAVHCRVAGVRSDNPSAIGAEQLSAWVRSGRFEFVGEVTDVRPHLTWCHCLVLPTYYHEGTPRSILEAMSTGRPVVTTDTPGCNEAVVDGQTGILVAPQSVDDLYRALLHLVHLDEIDLGKMGEAGYQRVVAQYSERIVLQQYGFIATEKNQRSATRPA